MNETRYISCERLILRNAHTTKNSSNSKIARSHDHTCPKLCKTKRPFWHWKWHIVIVVYASSCHISRIHITPFISMISLFHLKSIWMETAKAVPNAFFTSTKTEDVVQLVIIWLRYGRTYRKLVSLIIAGIVQRWVQKGLIHHVALELIELNWIYSHTTHNINDITHVVASKTMAYQR